MAKDYTVLDDLIPKTQELHRAIFDKGYEQGQYSILNVIKKEIKAESGKNYTNNIFNKGLYRAIEIIDENVLKVLLSVTPEEKTENPKKDILLKELAKEDLQVLSLAYVYAKNLQMYGVDVTKAIATATENAAKLDIAYHKGYCDAMNRRSESEDK